MKFHEISKGGFHPIGVSLHGVHTPTFPANPNPRSCTCDALSFCRCHEIDRDDGQYCCQTLLKPLNIEIDYMETQKKQQKNTVAASPGSDDIL
jgi:hypothetical protein